MSYLNILPSDIILHIIDKLTIEGIHCLTTIIDVDDIKYRYLYSLNFKFVYDKYAQIFDLDPLIEWKSHYLQMFKLHNLLKCHKDALTLNFYDKLAVNDKVFVINMNSHETEYTIDKLILSSSLETPKKVEHALQTKFRFHIPDYYLITMIELIKDTKLKSLKPRKRGLLFHIWIYSKIYADFLLKQIDFIIYYDKLVSRYGMTDYHVEIYVNLYGENKDGPRILQPKDVAYILSTKHSQDIYLSYGLSGLYFKHVFEHHPNRISYNVKNTK